MTAAGGGGGGGRGEEAPRRVSERLRSKKRKVMEGANERVAEPRVEVVFEEAPVVEGPHEEEPRALRLYERLGWTTVATFTRGHNDGTRSVTKSAVLHIHDTMDDAEHARDLLWDAVFDILDKFTSGTQIAALKEEYSASGELVEGIVEWFEHGRVRDLAPSRVAQIVARGGERVTEEQYAELSPRAAFEAIRAARADAVYKGIRVGAVDIFFLEIRPSVIMHYE